MADEEIHQILVVQLPAREIDRNAQAILWHQTANRVVDSFAHTRPFWWYLPLLPLLLFPWLLWPALWRALKRLWISHEPSVRFLLVWIIPTLIAFSLVSAKQPQYLLPLFPGAALLFARALADDQQTPRRLDLLLPLFFMAVIGVLLLLEATRRALGPALMIVATVFLAYTFLGPLMPGIIAHKGNSLGEVVNHHWITTSGVKLASFMLAMAFCMVSKELLSNSNNPRSLLGRPAMLF